MSFNPISWLTDVSVGKRGRWGVLVLWIVLAVVMNRLFPNLSALSNNSISSDIGTQESVRAQQLLQREFPKLRGLPAIVVFHNPAGLSEQDYQQAQQVNQWLNATSRPQAIQNVVSLYTVPQAKSELVSQDGTTMTMIVLLDSSQDGESAIKSTIKEIRAYTDGFDKAPLQVKVTGPAGIISDASFIFGNADFTLLIATIAIVLLILLVIYRSPLLVLLPLIAVALTQLVVNGLIGLGVEAGLFSIATSATSIVTVVLFGAGTDYVIFTVSRYREELQREQDHIQALRTTLRAVGETIISSAGTVFVALLTLLLAVYGLYRVLGAGLAIAIAVMALAGLTLVPALLSIFGRVAFWPFMGRVQVDSGSRSTGKVRAGLWERAGQFTARRPWVAALGSIILLVVLALGNLGVPTVFNFLTGFRAAMPSSEGYKLLAAHFEPGTLAPTTVLIKLKDGTDAYQNIVAIDQVTQALSEVKNVASVTGPTRPDGKQPAIAPAILQQEFDKLPVQLKEAIRAGKTGGQPASGQSKLDPRIIGLYGATTSYIAQDSSTIRLQVTLKSDPYDVISLDTIDPLRQAAKNSAATSSFAAHIESIQLSGETAKQVDTRIVSDRDKTIIIPLVLILIAIILGLLLRSLIAPLYLLCAVTLNYLAALGISSFIFTRIEGDAGVAQAVPLYTFVFLVALGTDYTIFLMARVREEAAKHNDLVKGTQIALSHTGGVITSAGLILAGTFAVLMTMPIRELYQAGITVAIGVLLDTFVVRGLLVPGVVLLLGKANWWPGKLKVHN